MQTKLQLLRGTAPVIDLHPNLPELYRRTVDNLKTVLETDTIRDESRALVAQLIDRIVVTPANDGTLKFELFGMLAPVLTRAHENGWPAPDDRVLTVVAEARNQRESPMLWANI